MGRRLVIMGGPGAGKGTQAQRIATKYSLPHISTGEIFRRHIEDETELGREIKRYLDKGQLAPDAVALKVVERRLNEPDCKVGYILDGFPRSLEQAQALDTMLETRQEQLNLVINLAVDDDEIVERLTARRMCPACGAIYNVRFNPPKQFPYCDRQGCEGVELVQRDDDREDTVRARLNVYHKTTEPIIQFYEERGMLKTVRGMGRTPDEIFKTVETLIEQSDCPVKL